MGLTITPEIFGQVATSTCSYCYLFEPLKVVVQESDTDGTKIYIDLEVSLTGDDTTIIATEVQYGIFDINPGELLSVDLMDMAKQYHNSNIYNYANIIDVIDTINGWNSVVSEYKYKFKFYSDVTATKTEIYKLPIIGGRTFPNFVPAVDETQALTEAELLGIDLNNRWNAYPVVTQSLVDPTLQDARPSVTYIDQTEGCDPEGYIIFKSRYGGWMTWGFDIKIDDLSGSYSGSLETSMFESTTGFLGFAYVPVNYTEVNSSYSYSLKDLSLSTEELRAASGIHFSPAIYIMNNNQNMELMKKTGASTPISSLANGGDFSLTLKNISQTTQKTR